MRLTTLFASSLVVLLSACEYKTNKVEKQFDLQGHRGCRGIFPENSIEGFIQAVNLGVNTLEMDVVITGDSQVIVSHEPWISSEICLDTLNNEIDSAYDKSLNIFRMTYAEVLKYDCGSRNHPRFPFQQKFRTVKPLLKDVISTIEHYTDSLKIPKPTYSIEIKSSTTGDNLFHPVPLSYCKVVLGVIEPFNIYKRVVIQSFDVRSLRAMHDYFPKYNLSLLVEPLENPKSKLAQLGFKVEILSPHFSHVDSALVDFVNEKEMKLIPWTVNEEEDMKRLLQLGVDGLITDYPDLAATLK